jgi:calpain
LEKPTHLKIILRKKGGKKVRQPLGLCITKAFPPTDAPEKTIINIGGKEATGKVKLMPNKTGMRVKATEKVPEFIPPKLDNVERKLQIQTGEWYIESSFKSEDVAALYAFWQPTQGPFLIVPSLAREESTADFTLTIFSSHSVEVKKLEESKNFVLSGKW